ncbi:MAG: DUF6690 family protein [Planctomycetota bacterium]
MLRSLIVPAVLIGLISLPFLLPSNSTEPEPPSTDVAISGSSTNPFQLASSSRVINDVSTQNSPSGVPITYRDGIALPATSPSAAPFNGGNPNVGSAPVYDERGNLIGFVPEAGTNGIAPQLAGMIPDYGSAETFYVPGNSAGPDLSADPLEFLPVFDLRQIFRYDVTTAWMQSRWDRISTTPVADGLNGYRVALVTGTNSWDLHGSLTYYFDQNQKCRRITFRGWAGDPNRFLEMLKREHGFEQQPTNQAGFYLAKRRRIYTGGLLMKHPAVIQTENRVQQIALLLELNEPASKLGLSDDFVSLIQGSMAR